jgi:hypothetical protein
MTASDLPEWDRAVRVAGVLAEFGIDRIEGGGLDMPATEFLARLTDLPAELARDAHFRTYAGDGFSIDRDHDRWLWSADDPALADALTKAIRDPQTREE